METKCAKAKASYEKLLATMSEFRDPVLHKVQRIKFLTHSGQSIIYSAELTTLDSRTGTRENSVKPIILKQFHNEDAYKNEVVLQMKVNQQSLMHQHQ
jgi:hypothetical protein